MPTSLIISIKVCETELAISLSNDNYCDFIQSFQEWWEPRKFIQINICIGKLNLKCLIHLLLKKETE